MTAERFEQFNIIEARLKKYEKTRAWLNTINSRFKVMPKATRQTKLAFLSKGDQIKLDKGGRPVLFNQGSLTFYPKGTADYVEDLILLQKNGKPFKEVKKVLKDRLQVLNHAVDSSLIGDKRVKEAGFIYNYRAAVKICKKFDLLGESQLSSKQWENLLEDRAKLGKQYYTAVEKMKQFTKHNRPESYKEVAEEKNKYGEKLDFIHAIMEATIRYVLSFLKTKYPEESGYIRHWFEAVRAIEKEDKRG